jgi:hypothetical protein
VKLLENWFVRGLLGQERRAIERSAFKYLEKTRHETLVWAPLELDSCASGIRCGRQPSWYSDVSAGRAKCFKRQRYRLNADAGQRHE